MPDDLYAPPAMPLYWDRLIADTMDLTDEEFGVYMRLMSRQWTKGSIPVDAADQARLTHNQTPAKMKKFAVVIGQRLQPHPTIPNAVSSPFMERVRSTMRERNSKNAGAGSKGGQSKWGTSNAAQNKRNRAERLRQARELGTHTAAEWGLLLHLCGNKCLRCGKQSPEVEIVKDHIHILAHGGSDAIENLQPLCRSCNAAKGPDRTDYVPPEIRDKFIKQMASGSSSDKPSGASSVTPSSSLGSMIHDPGSDQHLASLDAGSAGARAAQSPAMQFLRWMFDAGIKAGSLGAHLAVDPFAWCYPQLEQAELLLRTYGADEGRIRAERLCKAKAERRIRRDFSVKTLLDTWDWDEIKGTFSVTGGAKPRVPLAPQQQAYLDRLRAETEGV